MMIMNLGGIIYELQQMPNDKPVYFDFCLFRPTTLNSYRGDYSQLALGYTDEYAPYGFTVGTLLKHCEDALGKVFEGYKGGEYTMNEKTKVWVANYGHSTDTVITDVRHDMHKCLIRTAHLDYSIAMGL